MPRFRSLFSGLLLAALSLSLPAAAQEGTRINTGGPTGAYHNTFCPPIPSVLSRAYFHGYACTPSAGTLENIQRALTQPTNLGLVQLDVFAREQANDLARNGDRAATLRGLTVVRQDVACEGLWMVTNNPALADFGRVLELARRIRFVLPPEQSGSAATFAYLREVDAEGMGRVPAGNVSYAESTAAMLKRVAESTTGEVGFFVQFADPDNANIKTLVERGLTVVPVVSRPILRARVGDRAVYEVREFTLSAGGAFGIGGRARRVATACTPVALITASPETLRDPTARADQEELIAKVRAIPAADLLPQQGAMATLMRSMTRMSQGAVEALEAAAEAGRQRMQGGN